MIKSKIIRKSARRIIDNNGSHFVAEPIKADPEIDVMDATYDVAVAPTPIGSDATQQNEVTSVEAGEVPEEITQEVQYEKPDLSKEVYTLEDILRGGFDNVPFLVEGLIPQEGISLLVGESDIGKSTFHTQLGLSVVYGADTFLGRKLNTRHKRVIIVSTEEGIRGIGERIKKQNSIFSPDTEAEKRLIIILSCSDIKNKIKAELKKNPADLVVIDSFSDVFQRDMNTSNQVRTFFNPYQDISRELDCAVLFIHHLGKSREDKQAGKNLILGSVGIVDKSRQVLSMGRDSKIPSKRTLSILKGNYVSDSDKCKVINMGFDEDTRTFTYLSEMEVTKMSSGIQLSEEYISEITRMRKSGWTYEKIGKALGRSKSTISRLVSGKPELFPELQDDDEEDL